VESAPAYLKRKPNKEIEEEPTAIEEAPAQFVEVEELDGPSAEWWGRILAVQQSHR
jgi:hypothetical protein